MTGLLLFLRALVPVPVLSKGLAALLLELLAELGAGSGVLGWESVLWYMHTGLLCTDREVRGVSRSS